MAPAQEEQERESLQETAARLRRLTEEQAVSEAAGEEGKQEEPSEAPSSGVTASGQSNTGSRIRL